MRPIAILSALVMSASPALADKADVLKAEVRATSRTAFTFHVTVAHADTGWDHYADAWRVVGLDGTVYGTRTLHHPHVDEQPFTRSLAGVEIPLGVETVRIESHDSVHEWGGASLEVKLKR